MSLRPKDAAQKLGVSLTTLRRWDDRLQPDRTYGNHRRYTISSDSSTGSSESAKSDSSNEPPAKRRKIAYCRVSSWKQKDDLEGQKESFSETHPNHEIISDIGSGLNFKRKGLLRMVESIMQGDVEEVVVSHRDRLCRFAFELVEWI